MTTGELPGIHYQELPGTTRNYKESPEIHYDWRTLEMLVIHYDWRTTRNSLPGTARNYQKLPGITRNSLRLANFRNACNYQEALLARKRRASTHRSAEATSGLKFVLKRIRFPPARAVTGGLTSRKSDSNSAEN